MNYGLIGEKLGHSFSKPIHERLADYQYEITPLTREDFKDFMTRKEFLAINVTIPYKSDVIPYLEELDANAKTIGAVNTIVNDHGKLKGYNTDFYGFLYTLKNNNIDITGEKVLVLGNGGGAKAIIAVLNYLGAREIIIVKYKKEPGVVTYEECLEYHRDAKFIVNTSPVGMYPNILASPIDLSYYPECSAVIDIIYNPLETQLLKQAKSLGMISVNGLEMLIAQAKYAVEIFLDKEISDDVINEIHCDFLKTMKS